MTHTAQPQVTVDLMMHLSVVSHVLETEMAARLATLGITPRAYCVLSKALGGGELTQSALAEECHLDKTTMVVTMDALERDGLAERRASSTDRRARMVNVTPAGERVVVEARALVQRIYDEVLDVLPAPDRRAFVDSLVRLSQGRLATPMECERPPRRRAARPPRLVP